jgi:glycosyltransferase involved in cell wall biosynthesis
MERPLVSIIIPCYNAERWISEAIQSCLDQTYRPIEIIVIDDGSTDGSLEIIKSFGDAVRWETGPNRGGNAARNRGFALSQGEYIQWLDADDYIFPEKIERQVRFLQGSGAEGVYSDWFLHYEPESGRRFSDKLVTAGQQDIITALLSNEWWVSPNTPLWTRAAVLAAGGWDERLRMGQDRDFFLSVALSGAKIVYQPGCFAAYRRSGKGTVSTSNSISGLESHCLILAKAEDSLRQSNQFIEKYQHAMAHCYFKIARSYYDTDRTRYKELLKKVLTLNPRYQSHVSPIYDTLQRVFGFAMADRLASYKRIAFKRWLRYSHPMAL